MRVALDLRLVDYDEQYRDLSYEWLQDPELRRLTRSRQLTREEQLAWYAALPDRTDYVIWGIECDGVPVGTMGLKHIGVDEGGEYFFYLGKREFWGRGISAWAYQTIYEQARIRGLRYLYGIIAKENTRSMGVHTGHGLGVYREDDEYCYVRAKIVENWPEDEPGS